MDKAESPKSNDVIQEFMHDSEVPVIENGKQFILTIPGNITTGYNWNITNELNIIQKGVIKLITDSDNEQYEYIDNYDNLPGGDGVFRFKFIAIKPGNEIVYLNYKRSFETDENKIETAHFDVKVV